VGRAVGRVGLVGLDDGHVVFVQAVLPAAAPGAVDAPLADAEDEGVVTVGREGVVPQGGPQEGHAGQVGVGPHAALVRHGLFYARPGRGFRALPASRADTIAPMLRIGQIAVDPPLVLAPMAGITDRDFRLIVKRIGGVGLVTMEFVSSRALVEGDPLARKLMYFSDEERPLSIQIYGSDVATMAEAARIVEDLGADLVDLNMGCPANKVLRNCAGARLMGELPLARDMIRAVRRTVRIPMTVKFRLGLDERRKNHVELGKICEGEGVDAVGLHGRTARQMFTGEADWGEVARLKDALSIPVLGNGDLYDADTAVRRLRESGCDGLLVGRGATRNPWLFRQIAARLGGGRGGVTWTEPTVEDRRDLILDHFRTVVEREDPAFALHKLRTFSRWYTQGLPEGRRFRRRLSELADVESFLDAIEGFFGELELEDAA
jgi:tRNA-dihydrouridine synthase B